MQIINGSGAIVSPYDKLHSFPFADVKIEDERFIAKFNHIGEYYLSIPTEDAFFELRRFAGLDTGKGKSLIYGKSWFELGGIVLGQWLQAYSGFYAATGDLRYLRKAQEYVDQFSEIQIVLPDCGICNTCYITEKIVRGLLDAYIYCGIEKAYTVCREILKNFMEIPAIKCARLRLGDNGGSKDETSKEIEWYTMSESLYRFFDIAEEKGCEKAEFLTKLKAFAAKFEYKKFWDIFYYDKNNFEYSPTAGQNSAYFHAYSHLNSFNSAMYLYETTGDEYYLNSALAFDRFIEEKQMLVTGGYGAMYEWLMPKSGIIYALKNVNANFENQCNTYASFRLNRALAAATGRLAFGNRSELLYYNSFLSSVETDEHGHAFYYSDYGACGGTKWLHPTSWTCCSGTRPLAALEILRNVGYADEKGGIYINLFVNASLDTGNARVKLSGNYPFDNFVTVEVTPQAGMKENLNVYLRCPKGLSGEIKISGDVEYDLRDENGNIRVSVPPAGRTVFRVEFPLGVQESEVLCCDEGVRAFRYGPVALAADGVPVPEVSPKACDLKRRGSSLVFDAKEDMVFRPYMDYGLDEKYKMYFCI